MSSLEGVTAVATLSCVDDRVMAVDVLRRNLLLRLSTIYNIDAGATLDQDTSYHLFVQIFVLK